jgi:transposase
MKGKRGVRKPLVKVESLKGLNLNAAGLDIGAEEIYAAVPEDRAAPNVRVFKTFTVELYALADWLAACGVETVAMESTGVYWIPIYEILEARGFEVLLVNARQLKNVTGRKTDVLDCQWTQQLHTYGLLRGSFRPVEEICVLRAYVRQREMLLGYRSAHVQHMQKALVQMNVQLTSVISDVTGVTGLGIIRAILRGEREPEGLAAYRNGHCQKSAEEIAKALQGNWREEHLFALQQAVELYDYYNQKIAECDRELERRYRAFEPVVDEALKPLPARKRGRRKATRNEPSRYDLRSCLYRVCGVDLTQVDGLEALSVQAIISEIGLDMSRWPTVKHFTAWLRLSPDNRKSAGKVLSSKTKRTENRATQAFRLAAQSLAHSQSGLGAFYRRLRARVGAPQAIVATAHKLARIVYFMLSRREDYRDPGADYFEKQYRDRIVRNLQRKALEVGMALVPA